MCIQAVQKFTMICFGLLSAGINGVCSHTQKLFWLNTTQPIKVWKIFLFWLSLFQKMSKALSIVGGNPMVTHSIFPSVVHRELTLLLT